MRFIFAIIGLAAFAAAAQTDHPQAEPPFPLKCKLFRTQLHDEKKDMWQKVSFEPVATVVVEQKSWWINGKTGNITGDNVGWSHKAGDNNATYWFLRIQEDGKSHDTLYRLYVDLIDGRGFLYRAMEDSPLYWSECEKSSG